MSDKKDTRTRAQRNRAVRQEALREQLREQGHLQYVVKNIDEIENVATDKERANNLKIATELRMKLVNKYLPDLKAVEVTGEGGEEIAITEIIRKVVKQDGDS